MCIVPISDETVFASEKLGLFLMLRSEKKGRKLKRSKKSYKLKELAQGNQKKSKKAKEQWMTVLKTFKSIEELSDDKKFKDETLSKLEELKKDLKPYIKKYNSEAKAAFESGLDKFHEMVKKVGKKTKKILKEMEEERIKREKEAEQKEREKTKDELIRT